jgi:hypothetical protein
MTNRFLYIFIFCGVILLPPLHSCAAHAEDTGGKAEAKVSATPSPAPGEESGKSAISFLTPPFDDTPVALIDDEPITKYDLSVAIAQQEKQVSDDPAAQKKEYLDILDRLITSRLVVLEAKNIGLHETTEVTSQIDAYKKKQLQAELIGQHLQGLEPDPAEVEEMYRKMSREVKLYSLIFPVGPEARRFLEEVKDGNFDQVAKRYIEEGKAKEQKDETYVKIKDLEPDVAEEAYSMNVGGLSKIYLIKDNHLLYRLVDARFVEDPSVREEAARKVLETTRNKKALEYSFALEDKYVTFDKDLYNQLDFQTDLNQLLQDKRVLAKAKREGDPFVITVADLAAEMKRSFFHGSEKAAKLNLINERKDSAISNMIFRYTSDLEARHLGLDKTEGFNRKVKDFEISTLFNAFMNKLILPEVKVTEEEVRAYYDEHIDEYSSPAMLQMKSLVFSNRQDAENALDKLRKGADFNWVSANAANLVAPDTAGVLPLDKNLLSLTSLPEDLQELARDVKKGATLLYTPSEPNFSYVLLMDNVFPPEPQPYEEARKEAGKKIYIMKSEKLLAEYITKLKEEYPVKILLQNPKQ